MPAIARSPRLVPAEISRRGRLTARERVQSEWPVAAGAAGSLLIAGGCGLAAIAGLAGDIVAGFVITAGCAVLIGLFLRALEMDRGHALEMDRGQTTARERRDLALLNRARRQRPHAKSICEHRDLRGSYPQYAAWAQRRGDQVEFSVKKFMPPDGPKRLRPLRLWHVARQSDGYDALTGLWDIPGVQRTAGGFLVDAGNAEALLDAARAAQEQAASLEREACLRAARDAAVDGIALSVQAPASSVRSRAQIAARRELVENAASAHRQLLAGPAEAGEGSGEIWPHTPGV